MVDRTEFLQKVIGPSTRALERAFDEVIANHDKELKKQHDEQQKELKKRDEHQRILSSHIDKNVIENAYLKEENARLKYQLNKQGLNTAESTEKDSENTLGASVSTDDYRHLTDKYNELSKRFQETYQRLKYTERKNVVYSQQNNDMKESMRAWQKYADKIDAKEKLKAEARISAGPEHNVDERDIPCPFIPSSPIPTTTRIPRSPLSHEVSSPAPMHPFTKVKLLLDKEPALSAASHSENDPTMNSTEPEVHESHWEPLQEREEDIVAHQEGVSGISESVITHAVSNTPEEDDKSDKISSSQTTEDEIITQRAELAANPDSDDVPQFVSERSLKRKRVTATRLNVYADRVPSDGTPDKPFRIKEERHSSPPAPIFTNHLLRKETMDLDDLGPHVISTPHRRRREAQSSHSHLIGMLHYHSSKSDPSLIKTESAEQYREARHNDLRNHRTKEEQADGAVSELLEPRRNVPEALQQIDPNIQTTTHTDQEVPKKRRKKEAQAQAQRLDKFQMLTESGESLPENENASRLAPNVARTRFNRRLQASRGIQTPSKSMQKSPATVQKKHSAAEIPTPPSSSNRLAYTPSSRPGSRKAAPAETTSETRLRSPGEQTSTTRPAWQLQLRKDPSPDKQSMLRRGPAHKPQNQAPLRSRPKSELTASDFKANPAFNSGYSYAFSETIRKRADRACLPGCTRIECCGSAFRALAAASEPLSRSAEEELLEEYLGDAYDSMNLTQMDSSERKELVLQARTRQMSKQHGRHRQAYERHTTPPGFWRVDFPTTQEEVEDRNKAAELERRVVDERWMEAMRKGGRWMFRDE
ncbi:SAE2-domain-containing protein [Pleomassaria siparia CBS 279.74]|uniref:SAE2-domain-containing protein n=1 Tax=Pleomassaria siparia CBS 279.74 TaxID=1314801 RepID=A0A6G1KDT4_9PLEO|nr:SAE2-domain-containing protein [Pleomassaria siparia CBS 279.74]